MAHGGHRRRDFFAAEDALALRAEIAVTRLDPALDPRLQPFLDHARRRLRDVHDEAGLDAALAAFRPILDALARWPAPCGPASPCAGPGFVERRALSWPDSRVVRFCAALAALWAIAHGPDEELGRLFARTAVDLGRRAGLAEPARPALPGFMGETAIINAVTTPPATAAAPGVLDALAPPRHLREDVLARPAARRIERALRAAPGGLTAHEIAAAVGRHHSGVRAQLAQLERVGAVEVSIDPPDGRGRPARRYALAPEPAEREAAGHRELVRLLMSLVREAGFGPVEIERFGERQGASIARSGAGVREIRDAFERLGFAPHAPDDGPPGDLVLGRCPFADGVEATDGGLICLLHRGLARGIARGAAPGTEVLDLEVREPRRAGCRLRLSSPPPTRDEAA